MPGGPAARPAAVGVDTQRFFVSFSSGGFFFRRFLPSLPLLLSRMSIASCARHPWAGQAPVSKVFALPSSDTSKTGGRGSAFRRSGVPVLGTAGIERRATNL
jgi:hypothetical protein